FPSVGTVGTREAMLRAPISMPLPRTSRSGKNENRCSRLLRPYRSVKAVVTRFKRIGIRRRSYWGSKRYSRSIGSRRPLEFAFARPEQGDLALRGENGLELQQFRNDRQISVPIDLAHDVASVRIVNRQDIVYHRNHRFIRRQAGVEIRPWIG